MDGVVILIVLFIIVSIMGITITLITTIGDMQVIITTIITDKLIITITIMVIQEAVIMVQEVMD